MQSDKKTVCPHCGEEIRRNAKACPHCGSDDQTGWSQETYLDGIDLADDGSYEEIHQSEFGGSGKPMKKKVWIYITAATVLALFLVGIIAANLR